MQIQAPPMRRAPAAWLPLLLVAIVLLVAALAGGVAVVVDHDGGGAPVVTKGHDGTDSVGVTFTGHPSSREIIAMKS
jgi:hypothetical protein